MTPRIRSFLLALTAWYVCTYSGAKVAGPFTLLSDCQDEAKHLAKRYFNISEVCRSFSD